MQDAAPKPSKRPIEKAFEWEKMLLPLVVVVAISLASVLVMQAVGGVDRMRALVEQAGAWAPVVFVLLKASTYVFAPLSGTPLIIMAGAVFGLWPGVLYIVLGEILGACLNFWIARLLGRPGIRRFAGAKAIRRVDETTAHVGGWRALLVASVLFSSVYDFVSYAAGLSNLPFRQFFWVTVVGVIPSNFVYVLIGDRLMSGPGVVYLLGGVIAVALVLWVVRRRRR